MPEITEFPQSVIERIQFYVYALSDPRTKKVFYIGKGAGNRVFAHVNEALEQPTESDKLATIRSIAGSGRNVRYEIIRHGMSEEQALEVEAALIDFVGLPRLTNKVIGQGTDDRGRMSIVDIIATYRSEPVTITEPSILIIINRYYERGIGAERLYEVTRGNWVLGERRNKARYAFAVYRGLIREVYETHSWRRATARSSEQRTRTRWRFTGSVANSLDGYIGGSIEKYTKRGSQSPVLYLNC